MFQKRMYLYAVIALLLFGWFYWFQWRPAEIKKSCSKQAYEDEFYSSSKRMDRYKYAYEVCLHDQGL